MTFRYTGYHDANVLDITSLPSSHLGLQLRKDILNGVRDTQGIIMSPLPNILLMTKPQFDDLVTDPAMEHMYQSTDYMYFTELNVMEVRVKDAANS
jgi:hypothetical protein